MIRVIVIVMSIIITITIYVFFSIQVICSMNLNSLSVVLLALVLVVVLICLLLRILNTINHVDVYRIHNMYKNNIAFCLLRAVPTLSSGLLRIVRQATTCQHPRRTAKRCSHQHTLFRGALL